VLVVAVASALILYFVFPETLLSLLLASARRSAGLHRAEVEIPGFHIVYLEGGQGEPLVLLHGLGAEKDVWTDTARSLTGTYRVLAPDLPGFGESSKPDGAAYDVATQVQHVAAFVHALGLTRFSIGGNSMGGWIAGAYAAAHPEQIVTAWLMDPGGVAAARNSEMMRIVDRGGLPPMFPRTGAELQETFRFIAAREPAVPGFLIPVIARKQAQSRERNLKVFRTLLAEIPRAPLEKALAGSKTPTLIVWGKHDRLCDPAGAAVLHDRMPNSAVKMMDDIGHVPMLEDPAATARDYLDFRQRLGRIAGRAADGEQRAK
jgi:pimeloyl-ACP methyl ester carboxylesterase